MASISSWYHSSYAQWNQARRRTPFGPTPPVPATAPMAAVNTTKKAPESLFGPNIGVVNSGPAWTESTDKKLIADQLTPEIVQGWIEKSKQPSQPTTTLQALVNLKRPTLRLSPLQADTSEDAESHLPQHGLEFEYDADAPHVGIYVHVLLKNDHPEVEHPGHGNGLSKTLVFETVVPGAFGSVLKLDQGATLELDRFDAVKADAVPATADTGEASAVLAAATSAQAQGPGHHRRRRFTIHFRRRSVTGPALAVVDDAANAVASTDNATNKEDENAGVRITIRLAALDEQRAELASPNEQVTYLHVVRFGAVPPSGEEDMRPWVVKVVKREATIGPHTFQLHEIYGLSSASTPAAHPVAPAAAIPGTSPTYPPTSPEVVQPVHEDEPSSECLLCLSSPREVVLLPCRHLVACFDCAKNFVEFGAGGAITHNDNDTAEAGAGGDNVPPVDGAAAEAAIPAAQPSRRKRKARGYFCPVCRQAYTALLRITTSAPELEVVKPEAETVEEPGPSTGAAPSRGLGSFTPGFLRNLSRGLSTSESGAAPEAPVPAMPAAVPIAVPPPAATSSTAAAPAPAAATTPAQTSTLPPDLERGLGA